MDRFIPIKGIITRKNKTLIPIWDDRLTFENHEDYGNIIHVDEDYQHHSRLSDLLYDLETKTVSLTQVINYYETSDFYKVGDSVYYSEGVSSGPLTESVIKEILYEEFDIQTITGKRLLGDSSYYLQDTKDLTIIPDMAYSIKTWKPWYLMEDGYLVKYSFSLHRKKVKNNVVSS